VEALLKISSDDLVTTRVYIPKPGTSKVRPLGVPRPEWRVYLCMKANIYSFLLDGVNPDQHGYFPGRGTLTCWRELLVRLSSSQSIYEYDMTGFFDSVSLKGITPLLESYGFSRSEVEWIRKVSRNHARGIEAAKEPAPAPRWGGMFGMGRGVVSPQGTIMIPCFHHPSLAGPPGSDMREFQKHSTFLTYGIGGESRRTARTEVLKILSNLNSKFLHEANASGSEIWSISSDVDRKEPSDWRLPAKLTSFSSIEGYLWRHQSVLKGKTIIPSPISDKNLSVRRGGVTSWTVLESFVDVVNILDYWLEYTYGGIGVIISNGGMVYLELVDSDKRGLPQGSAISGVLSCTALNPTVFCPLWGKTLGYADDGLVLSDSPLPCASPFEGCDWSTYGIVQNVSKSGFVKIGGRWLRPLKFLGLTYVPPRNEFGFWPSFLSSHPFLSSFLTPLFRIF
jgi:hypothetical protein